MPAEPKPQSGTVTLEHAVCGCGQFHRPVFAVDQFLPHQRLAVEVPAGGVEPPVFSNAYAGVDVPLVSRILVPGAFGGYFQHEVRGFARLPWEINQPFHYCRGLHVEGHVKVRPDPDIQVSAVIADEGVAASENGFRLSQGVQMGIQNGKNFGKYGILKHTVRQWLRGVRIELQAGVVYVRNYGVGMSGFGGHRRPPGVVLITMEPHHNRAAASWTTTVISKSSIIPTAWSK